MNVFNFYDIDDAFTTLVGNFQKGEGVTKKESRNGPVLQYQMPVLILYRNPRFRVLLNSARDANPFFHLYESVWMLAGKNEVDKLAYYVPRMKTFSDDGVHLHGAYGFRWRHRFGYDQLDWIVEHLKHDPDSRRCVLQMWDAGGDVVPSDLFMADNGGKDTPCNTQAYFSIRSCAGCGGSGYMSDIAYKECANPNQVCTVCKGSHSLKQFLYMTVCNRSNDLVWGCLGANAVHFSYLQEYLAARIGVGIGYYYQFTNNLHVYADNFEPEAWLSDIETYPYKPNTQFISMIQDPERFEKELIWVADAPVTSPYLGCQEPWFKNLIIPAMLAYTHYKEGDLFQALDSAGDILQDDWRTACVRWLTRRLISRKHKSKHPYEALEKQTNQSDS